MRSALARHPVTVALFLLVLAFTLAPLVVVVAIGFSSSPFLVFPPPGLSLRWFQRFLADPSFTRSLAVSLGIALAVAAAGTTLGTAMSFGLTRIDGRWARGLSQGLVLSPLLFPVIVLALALLLFLASLDLLGSWLGLVIAHLLIVLPLAVANLTAALAGLSPEVEQAAMSLGAGPWRTFLFVTLPQVASAVAGTALLAFLFSFNDVTFAAFLGGPGAQTLPLKLFAYIRYQLNPLIGAVSTLFIAVTLVAILVIERLLGFGRLLGLRE